MYSTVKLYCDSLLKSTDQIHPDRKILLEKLAEHIHTKIEQTGEIKLVFICTHNSRRSHFGQVWAHVAADYFGIHGVQSYSGGTVVTSFNQNAINALKRIGFTFHTSDEKENPVYELRYDDNKKPIQCFSKLFNDPVNPSKAFTAVMTCGDAEENCPFVPGADLRISTTYNDPKEFDNSPLKDNAYDERCKQIATEIFYVFSCVISKK